MKRKWFGFVGIGLALVVSMLSGCITPTASISRPEIPMSEHCVINILDVSFYDNSTRFYYGDISLSAPGRNIVPAGKYTLKVAERHNHFLYADNDGSRITETYERYSEEWSVEYDFLPGKVYTIEREFAYIGIEGEVSGDVQVDDFLDLIVHLPGEDIEVITDSNATLGPVHFNPFLLTNLGTDGGNGPAFVSDTELGNGFRIGFTAGPSAGLQIISGHLDMALKAETSGFAGMTGFDMIALNFGFSYGGMAAFGIGPVTVGLGGGMVNGWLLSPDAPDILSYTMPYAELAVSPYGSAVLQSSIFGRYYFNDPGYFTVGIKIH